MTTKVLKEEVIRVRIEKNLKDKLKEMCEFKDISMSELITYMIENEINKYEFKMVNKKKIESRIENTERKISKLRNEKFGV